MINCIKLYSKLYILQHVQKIAFPVLMKTPARSVKDPTTWTLTSATVSMLSIYVLSKVQIIQILIILPLDPCYK